MLHNVKAHHTGSYICLLKITAGDTEKEVLQKVLEGRKVFMSVECSSLGWNMSMEVSKIETRE